MSRRKDKGMCNEEDLVEEVATQQHPSRTKRSRVTKPKKQQRSLRDTARKRFDPTSGRVAPAAVIREWIKDAQEITQSWSAGEISCQDFIDEFFHEPSWWEERRVEDLQRRYMKLNIPALQSTYLLPQDREVRELLVEGVKEQRWITEKAYCAARYIIDNDCDDLEARRTLPDMMDEHLDYVRGTLRRNLNPPSHLER